MANKYLSLEQGLKFPWQKPSRLWYALWLLVPIFGWFALAGYWRKIIKNLVKGKNKELPEFGKFWDNFKQGFIIFLKMIPIFIVFMIISGLLEFIPIIGWLAQLAVSILFYPYLIINLVATDDIAASFEFKKVWKVVVEDNLKDYLIVMLKSFVYGLLYGLLSIVLVGIPCSLFGRQYFLCDFYAKTSKTNKKKR